MNSHGKLLCGDTSPLLMTDVSLEEELVGHTLTLRLVFADFANGVSKMAPAFHIPKGNI